MTVSEVITDSLPPTKDLKFFYKTTAMMLTPNLYVENNPTDSKVAVGATFAPSFGDDLDDLEIVEEDEPEKLKVSGSDYHFVFIIDRSGSMNGENIQMAREALQLFM
jgi:Mg-chelatase subunit ChlD